MSGKKDDPVAPAAPDPTATAAAQEQTNIGSAIAQANLNRINQNTPQGSLSYTQDTNADGTAKTNADGTPVYTQTQTLAPDEQKKYDLNNQVAIALDGLANQGTAQVSQTMATPFSYDGMQPEATTLNLQGIAPAGKVQTSLDYSSLGPAPTRSDFSADATNTANAQYAAAASRLDPQWSNNDNDVSAKLAAQGISENSDAYRRAQTTESNAKTDAYNQANYSATAAGNAEQQALYGEDLSSRQQSQNEIDTQGEFANTAQGQIFGQNAQTTAVDNANSQSEGAFEDQARQQQIEQAAYLRNMPIQDIATLLGTGSGVTSPDFTPVSQVGVAAPDYSGMVASNYAQQMQQYNAQQASQAQMMGSIFGAAGTVGAGFMMSDRRFKENIRRIGTLANGIATYAFNYIGSKVQQFGVMAQEVLGIIPGAVSFGDDGYMRVNYGKVY